MSASGGPGPAARRVGELRRSLARRLRPGRRDGGTSLIELVVTLMLVAIVVPLTMTMVRELAQQSTEVNGTVLGVQQDQQASTALLQYLHSATIVLPGSDATTLDASILYGTAPGGGPETATLHTVLTSSPSPGGDAVLTTTITTGSGRSSRVQSNYALDSSSVFTYYYVDASGTTTTTGASASPALSQTSDPTQSELSEIVAVGIDATFLAGPRKPIGGLTDLHASTFQTTVYLQNASGAPAPASATTLSFSGGGSAGSSLTVTATVSPVPDGGTVSFGALYDGSSTSLCQGSYSVSTTTGQASCTFTATDAGTYGFTASFSGTAKYQPSSAPLSSIAVLGASATAVSAVGGATRGSLVVTATFTSSPAGARAPTGTATVSVRQQSSCWYGCTTRTATATLSPSTQNPGTASTISATFGNLTHSASYAVTVSYGGDSTYAPSTGTATGTAS